MATDAPERPGHARPASRATPRSSASRPGCRACSGLAREVVAAKYFGVTAAMSAFTIAFQVPNLVRALFADSALQGAFVPVFTRAAREGGAQGGVPGRLEPVLPDHAGARRASRALFILFAEPIMSRVRAGLRRRPGARGPDGQLARLMFPIVLLLALSGLVVGMLNSFEHFAVPGARAGRVEPRDHRRARRARAGDAGGRRDLRLRDRHPGRDGRPVPAAAAVAARTRRAAHVHDRLARRARAARAQADAAGHDRARADQPRAC